MQVGFLNFYGAIMNLRQERSDLIANNIANADTPNYKAVDLPFNAALSNALGAPVSAASGVEFRQDGVVGLNGNDVSLDSERVEAAQNGQQLQASSIFLHQSTTDLVTALRPNPSGT
ncbi:MAG: flagellar biosynthesis protein FlgB [Rhodospirillales bacterium]|nr:flagellar biosynthesis protein FlgB [Rhodospirillales bacterium]